MSFSAIITQSVFQGIGAFLIGTASDHFFEPSVAVFDHNFVRVASETAIQIGFNSIAINAWYDFMFNRGVRGDDPTRGIPFILILIASQKRLLMKIGAISNFIGNYITKQTRATGPKISTSDSENGYIIQSYVPPGSNENPAPSASGKDEELPLWATQK